MEDSFLETYNRFLKRIDNQVNVDSVLNMVRAKVDNNIESIPILWITPFYEFLNYEPHCFWNKQICESTFRGLENLYKSVNHFNERLCSSLSLFTLAYFTYLDLAQVINTLEPLNDELEIKTRMYKIPIYTSIIEGCLSNLFRMLRDLIDLSVDKDLKPQNNLNSLCDLLVKYGFEQLCDCVDVDIRNAINHGGIFITKGLRENISFIYNKGSVQRSKELSIKKFDELIEGAFDNASGIILGFLRFFARYPEILWGLESYSQEDLLLGNALSRIHLSFPGTRCAFIEERAQSNVTQINLRFVTDMVSREDLLEFSIEVAAITRRIYPNNNQYMFLFHGERMNPGWIRYFAPEIDEFLEGRLTHSGLIQKAIDHDEVVLAKASQEEIDIELVRNHRFPNINENSWKIRDITDCSLSHLKRFRASLFIGNIRQRRKIVRAVNDAIRKLKVLFNPPQLTAQVKHGDMPADAIYLSVYFNHNRQKDRELSTQNQNFVLIVQYNAYGFIEWENTELPFSTWEELEKDDVGNIFYAWNPNVELEK